MLQILMHLLCTTNQEKFQRAQRTKYEHAVKNIYRMLWLQKQSRAIKKVYTVFYELRVGLLDMYASQKDV